MNLIKTREDLSKQTLLIEKMQSAIKYAIKDGVVKGKKETEIFGLILLVITQGISKMSNKEFGEIVKVSLYTYANKAYKAIKGELRGVNLPKSLTDFKTKMSKQYEDIPLMDVEYSEGWGYWNTAQGGNEFANDYMKKVKKAFENLATSEAKDEYSTRVSLRNVSEMAVRYERKNEELQELINNGIDLVWISTHGNCSERCQPWQGKLYSISGKYGEIDGIKYQPLSNATDIFYTTKAGRTYKNGCISGFGCRHRLDPYNKGNKPIHISAEIIDKEREINQKQRAFERKIREYKLKSIGLKGIDSREARKYMGKAREAYENYKKYCRENKVAFYPARCKVFDGEEELNNAIRKFIEKKKKILEYQ